MHIRERIIYLYISFFPSNQVPVLSLIHSAVMRRSSILPIIGRDISRPSSSAASAFPNSNPFSQLDRPRLEQCSISYSARSILHYSPFDAAASNIATGLAADWPELFVISRLDRKVAPRL
jgi:hypothetical protein